MSKETKRQANFRLPKNLLDDLRLVSETTGDPQSEIVRRGIEQKVERLKSKLNLTEKREAAAVV